MQNNTRDEPDTSKIEVKTSNISGKGTFAKKKIMLGEHIKTLSGDPIITEPDVTSICIELGISCDDPLQIGNALFLILSYESKTINHSCNPNAGIKNQSDLFAISDINIGDEITYDYSTTSGANDKWTMRCSCETMVCRKIIGNILTITPVMLAKYIKLNALPDFIKEQLRKMGRLHQE